MKQNLERSRGRRASYLRTLSAVFVLAVSGASACGGGDDAAPAAAGCPAGFVSCDGGCTAVQFDPANCGTCGHACEPGEMCSAGACVLQCAGGTTRCGDICTNTATDLANCGGCDQACDPGELCVEGACSAFCPAGFDVCADLCVRLSSDADNCGQCGKTCKAGEECSKGTCVLTCPAGMSACQNECVNPHSDARHCGGCDQPCVTGQVCVSGECLASCPAGFEDCGGLCVDTRSDLQNCGACDHACDPGEACVNKACTTWCPSGQTACASGCVDLLTDTEHCGVCGKACDVGEQCLNGACAGKPNGYGLTDAWGYLWDGIQRPARTWDEARDDCVAVGARLPTATELHRNHAGQTNVAPLGEPHQTSWLWTSIATYNDDIRRALVRWSDGATASSPESSPRSYRCVWPDYNGDAFDGDFCNGTPGAGCAAAGPWWNVDTMDRPALDFAAAANECAFYHSSITTTRDAQELIHNGWANPSSAWLWAADSATWYSETYGLALIRWTTVPQPEWGYDAGTDGNHAVSSGMRPFRCIGKRAPSIGVAPPSPQCWGGGCVSALRHRAKLVADSADRLPAGFAVASETCRSLGGALPDVGELTSLVHEGWVGSGQWLWSSEPQTWYDGNYGYAVFQWSAAGTQRWSPDSASMSVSAAGSARPFRCVWHETFEGATQTSCSGTQNQAWDGTKFSCVAAVAGDSAGNANPNGQQIVDDWGNAWDMDQRAEASFADASADCAAQGARLPTPTEVYRVRASQALVQPIGDASATATLWTTIRHQSVGNRIVVRVSDGTTEPANEAAAVLPYRCVWPGSKGSVLDQRACTGTGATACYTTARLRIDAHDRAAMPASSASNECEFFGGRLPEQGDLIAAVHGGAPNGSNVWLWLAEPVAWYPNSFGYAIARWSGAGSEDWQYENPSYGAIADENDFRPFRCVFTDELR